MRSVVDGLCSFRGRGACTDAERRAALWLHDELRARGHEPFVETRWVRPQRWAALALGCLLCVAGGLLAVPLPVAGLAVAALGALSLAVEAFGRAGPVRLLFPRRATQDVLTVAAGDAPLAIVAAYDAPRSGPAVGRALLRRAPLVASGALVAAAAGARVGGVEAAWLGAAQLVPTIVLLGAFAAAVDAGLSAWSPGANDDASGVAVALALLDELAREPPRSLAPALLLAGAGHAVRPGRPEGVVLELGPCGAGRPVVRGRHPQAETAAARAAEALGATVGGDPPIAAGVRIACTDAHAHTADDTAVDPAALEAALDLALGVVDALDAA